MRSYTASALQEILRLHQDWLSYKGVARANLRNANLRCANLRNANLRCANLRDANLAGADLRGADLRGADLADAYLADADLRDANLADAYLRDANLRGADLADAYLADADLRDAYLAGANLADANLADAKLPNFLITPQQGAFIAWKKASLSVVRLEIPADAHRTSTLVGRKCRAEFVRVMDIDGDTTPGCSVTGDRGASTIYTVGEITRADKYNDDIRVECAGGIHFFITREEAEAF